MKPLTHAQLNRIKIKDLMYAIKQTVTIDNSLKLYLVELYNRQETSALKEATDENLAQIEKLFIEKHLKIRYYPSQNTKTLGGKIVPIDYNYGSDNS